MKVIGLSRAAGANPASAFRAAVLRDLTVLNRKRLAFAARTLLQPALMLFTFTYVLPKVSLAPGAAGRYSQVLIPGVMGTVILVQAVQVLAVPMFMELMIGDLMDRLSSPLTLRGLAAAKVTSGGMQILVATALVVPLSWVIPVGTPDFHPNWPALILVILSASLLGAVVGFAIGIVMSTEMAAPFFSTVTIPTTFLGCVYYPWNSLHAIPWLKWLVCLNPLVYINEGLRAALGESQHMPTIAIVLGMATSIVLFALLAWRGLIRRLAL